MCEFKFYEYTTNTYSGNQSYSIQTFSMVFQWTNGLVFMSEGLIRPTGQICNSATNNCSFSQGVKNGASNTVGVLSVLVGLEPLHILMSRTQIQRLSLKKEMKVSHR